MEHIIPQNDPQSNSSQKSQNIRFCGKCQKEKHVDKFPPSTSHSKNCRECINKYNKMRRDKIKKDPPKRKPDKIAKGKSVKVKSVYVPAPLSRDVVYMTCVGCGKEKNSEKFGIKIVSGEYAGKNNRCRECEKFKQRQQEAIRKEKREQKIEEDNAVLMAMPYAERVKVVQRDKLKRHIKSHYGIHVGRYDEMLKAQNGLCAICHNPPKEYDSLVVDHDHATGYVRGLLCRSCNIGLGHFRDSSENLSNAAEYLKKSVWEY